jgi:hypothetical protein
MGQASIKHFQEAAAVIGLLKVGKADESGDRQILKLSPMKMRQSKCDGTAVWLIAELGKMKILNEQTTDPSAEEEDNSTTTTTVRVATPSHPKAAPKKKFGK